MSVSAMEKPTFTCDQIVSSSVASKKFAEIRKRAKLQPQFISDHNTIDAVILDYSTYENMYQELQQLRDVVFYQTVADRIKRGDTDPKRQSKTLRDVMGKDTYDELKRMDIDAIADEDLFE